MNLFRQDVPQEKDESLIPKGCYCYTRPDSSNIDKIELCPYWDKDQDRESQGSGYCHFLKQGDWDFEWLGLLWDQCKECGINDDIEEEL